MRAAGRDPIATATPRVADAPIALYHLFTLAEAGCLGAAWLLLRRRHGPWHLHRYYLLVVLALELAGIAYAQYRWQVGLPAAWPATNHFIYNVQLLVTAAFVGWFLYRCIDWARPHRRRWLYGWYAVVGMAYAANAIANGGLGWLLTGAFKAFVLAVMAGGFYFLWLSQHGPVAHHRGFLARFIWVFATCSFYFGMALYLAFFDVLVRVRLPIADIEVSRVILNALNLTLYATWSYAFYLCRNRRN